MDSVVYASYNAQVVTLQLLGVQDCSLRLRRGNAQALRTGGGGGVGRGGAGWGGGGGGREGGGRGGGAGGGGGGGGAGVGGGGGGGGGRGGHEIFEPIGPWGMSAPMLVKKSKS